MSLKLRISAIHHKKLKNHLFPGDGLEAAAILICGRAGINRSILCCSTIIKIPYEACSNRTSNRLSWPGEYLEKAIDEADKISGTIILTHSHPGGCLEFSSIDDESDQLVIPSLTFGVNDSRTPHGTAIMIPDGALKVRLYDRNLKPELVTSIVSIGHDIFSLSNSAENHPLAFSSDMTKDLKNKTACIVGVSGTGSLVAEMVARLGVGRIILIDFDVTKHKNLNRIVNATCADADAKSPKIQVLKRAIISHSPSTDVIAIETAVDHPKAIVTASESDIIFSCVDSMEGRYYCDLMTQCFICPLIDVGVMIPTRKNGSKQVSIGDVCGRIDYIYPGGNTLWDRGVISGEGLAAEYLRKIDPETYKRQLEEGYLKGVQEEAPSVISLNMRAASAGVNEWLARLYNYRHISNSKIARTFFSLASLEEDFEEESNSNCLVSPLLGRGLYAPLLGIPDINYSKEIIV